ncbi:MAG: ribose 5-phosphate isomerase B [Spirochaetota bacterium]
MKIVIANDHGAIDLKNELMTHLCAKGYDVVNLGVDSEGSVDYPDMAEKAAAEYVKGGYDFGILLCGTGIGISIAANKIDGIRCALPQNSFAAEMAKAHNNANFIAFGGRIVYGEKVTDILDAFISASFEGGRHEARIKKMMALENR